MEVTEIALESVDHHPFLSIELQSHCELGHNIDKITSRVSRAPF